MQNDYQKQRSALMPDRSLWVAFVPYIVICVIHVSARFAENPIDAPTKLMLMPLLMLAAVVVAIGVRGIRWSTVALLLGGIFFSWLGDGAGTFFPMFEDELPMMLLNFGIAHLLYMFIFWRSPGIGQCNPNAAGKKRFVTPWALMYIPAYIILVGVIVPNAGSLAIPVAFYAVVLTGTAILALRVGKIVAWGGFWFLVSDAILGFRIFLPDAMPPWTSGMVMLTYTLGQGLIVYGVMRRARAYASSTE